MIFDRTCLNTTDHSSSGLPLTTAIQVRTGDCLNFVSIGLKVAGPSFLWPRTFVLYKLNNAMKT